MNKISTFLASVFCLAMFSGCAIHTVTYQETGDQSAAAALPRPLYITEADLNGTALNSAELRAHLSKRAPQVFTDKFQAGVPTSVSVKQTGKATDASVLNNFTALSFGLLPSSICQHENYRIEFNACGEKGISDFQYTLEEKMCSPLIAMFYPLMGKSADEKAMKIFIPQSNNSGQQNSEQEINVQAVPPSFAFALTSPHMDKVWIGAASRIDGKKMLECFKVRVKNTTPAGLTLL